VWWLLRFDSILAGVLAYEFSRSAIWNRLKQSLLKNTSASGRSIWFKLAIAIFVGLTIVAAQEIRNPFIAWGIVAILNFLIVISALNVDSSPSQSFSSVAIEWLGLRSYSLYLCHIPVGLFVRSIEFQFLSSAISQTIVWQLGHYLLTAVLVFGVAEMNYRWVELPSLARCKKIKYWVVPQGDQPKEEEKLAA
jgi:peptidoglycan/LPS O-acetylase OafA/YrhL